jgi:hypothetical protein
MRHVHCNADGDERHVHGDVRHAFRNADKMDVDNVIDRQSARGYDYNLTDVANVAQHKRFLLRGSPRLSRGVPRVRAAESGWMVVPEVVRERHSDTNSN